MADNQMIKIEFDFDLGNVPESAKKFAEYLKGIEADSKVAQAQLKTLGNEINKTANNMSKSGDSIKKSNQQWTNFALILQDLPYGFRGIQNNLPAVIGGLAGMTGPIYLVSSAIIALFTAWDMGAFGATKSTNDWKKALKETNDEIRNTLNYTNAEVSNLQGLVSVMTDVNSTESQREAALKEIKEAITKVDEAEGKKITGLYSAITAVNLYTEAIQQQQMQEVIGKRIAEISLNQIEKRNKSAIETAKANRGIHPIDFFMGNTELDNLNSEIIANETLLRQLEDLRTTNAKALLANPFSKYNAKGQTAAQGANEAKKQADLKNKANEAETNAYLNSLDDRAKKEFQAGLDLQKGLETMRAAGYSNSETYYASYRANMDKIAKEYDDKEYKRSQDSINANIAFETKIYNDSNRAFDAIKKKQADDEVSFAKKQTSNIETELTIQEKLNKDSLIRRIDYTKQALAKVAVIAAMSFNPNTIGIYLDAIDKLNAKLRGYGEQWDVTAKSINDSIQNFIISSFTTMGESLGKALAGENVDVFNAFAMLIADALTSIGTSLIAYATMVGLAMTLFADPLTWPIALAAGIAAVAAGAFLKAKLSKKQNNGATAFANGGIVSGPTMGLIGEYPGAKSNPEVVAPLDKLKDMIGGNGGGSFVLRGSDLVLALNRSETSLNLRRGS
jgi:hypothetical protein